MHAVESSTDTARGPVACSSISMIRVGGDTLSPLAPREAMNKGLAFLTEDRRGEGLMMEASITNNIVLPSLIERSSGFMHWLKPAALGRAARDVAERVRVNAKAIDRTAVRTLSGGNQQKVVIAKWLLRAPTIFIVDEPTRGIDVGAKYEVYKSSTKWSPEARRSSLFPLRLRSSSGWPTASW
jgi:ribose transport system ATP-binding protein